jgi:DNA-binding LacI/PurR family transcriptional regulator
VTIKEIAAASGVSIATVTRALQGHPRVRPETRARVQEAAEALGYRPNDAARTLATGASNAIGLLLPSIGDRYWGEVVAGIESGADRAGFSVLLATSHGDTARSRRMLDVLLAKRVDGFLVASRREVEEALEQAPLPVPVVRIGPDGELDAADLATACELPPSELASWLERRGLDTPPEGVTAFDDVDAATIAVEHLAGLGHQRIAFVGASTRRSAALRVVGFRESAQRVGAESADVVASPDSLEESDRVSRELLAGRSRPTAVVAYDDMVAIGVIRAAHALGLRVPEQVSVVGIDDIDVAAFIEPPLTTVRQPKHELGRRAADALLTVLHGGAMPVGQAVRGELMLRGSTARPSGARARTRAENKTAARRA